MIRDFINIFTESARSFEGQEKDEQVVLLIRKHPFVALLPISIFIIVGIFPILIYLLFAAKIFSNDYFTPFLFISSIFYGFIWLGAFYFLTMYTLNTVIITNKRIIDNDQHGFFDRKVSELHLYRVQDVSTHTRGIIQTMLHFGDMEVQTAAADRQFVFDNIPKPELVKDTVMRVVASAHSGIKAMAVNNSADEEV